MLVGDIVRLNGKFRGGDTALIIGDRHVTYGEMNEKVDAVAAALIAAATEFRSPCAPSGFNATVVGPYVAPLTANVTTSVAACGTAAGLP